MLLSEKIMQLRKKNGWSQEELAAQLDVSRQSVSKWEAGNSIPDLNKILLLGQIFGVSTDYLLKDEIEDITYSKEEVQEEEGYPEKRVSVEMAHQFMDLCKKQARKVAIAVALCILSPVTLILLAGISETGKCSEDLAAGIGLIVLLVLISSAVCLFISNGHKMAEFSFMENSKIDLEYGAVGIIKERRKQYQERYNINMIIGVTLCILCAVPIFICVMLDTSDLVYVTAVGLLLIIVAAAVQRMVEVSMVWDCFNKLLMEGDYTKENKTLNKKKEAIGGIYWTIVVAIYLGWSFYTEDWQRTWIVFPVAGVLYAAIINIAGLVIKEK